MAAQRSEYVARQVIDVNGVRAFNPGDPVPAGVVDNLGLVVGEDVLPSDLKLLPKPARNAKRADWAAYALSQGMGGAELDGMGRDEIAARFEEPAPEPAEEPDGLSQA